MNDYAPILLALLFVVVSFSLAMSRGVVSLLASGGALAGGAAVLLWGFQALPLLARSSLGITLGWQAALTLSAIAGLVVMVVLRLFFGIAFKRFFQHGSRWHAYADGLVGGVLSLPASLVTVFFFFTCVRAAGTVQELNYIDSLAREGIEEMGGRIPPYPTPASWRNVIDRLPLLAPWLDWTDPFSRRSSRNAAALLLADRGRLLREHMRQDPHIGPQLEGDWSALAEDAHVARALQDRDRVALVTAPALQALSSDAGLQSSLSRLRFEPALKDFVRSLELSSESEPVPSP